jgi:hypothetical protein
MRKGKKALGHSSELSGTSPPHQCSWSRACRSPHRLDSQHARDHSFTSAYHVAVRAQRRLVWIFPPREPL